jgi:hypothetical protein
MIEAESRIKMVGRKKAESRRHVSVPCCDGNIALQMFQPGLAKIP